jgi:sodium-dependent phosphate transporter
MSDTEATFNLDEYLWVAVIAVATGFVYAFAIGANDVANAFASTVASRSLTLKQAVIVASIFEFCGAFFLGASVTSTIRGKIVDVDLYENQPEILMWGMTTSLITASAMLLVATYFGMPVSTTHTIVGSIMGFSIAAQGFDSVNWNTAQQIFVSWAVSPLVSGFLAFLFFGGIRYFVLRHDNSFQRAVLTFPIVLIVGIGIDLFYILYKATANFPKAKDMPLYIALPVAFGTGIVCALIWQFGFGPVVVRRIERKSESNTLIFNKPKSPDAVEKSIAADIEEPSDEDEETPDDEDSDWEYNTDDPSTWEKPAKLTRDVSKKTSKPKVRIVTPVEVEEDDMDIPKRPEESPEPEVEEENTDIPKRTGLTASLHRASKYVADNTYNQDLKAQSMHENAGAAQIWDNVEDFDPKAEELFTYIQVFTACLNSFAHGANDVANALGPVSAVLTIYQTGAVSSKAPVQKWILAYGGVGLVVGLLLYGYRVMKSIGYKLTALSPSRGASAELSASLFVVTASFLGIPVSSTQSIVGAIFGVGLLGGSKNVQWFFLIRVCCSWVAIFLASTILSAGVFSFGAYAPTLQAPVVAT